MTSRQLKSNIRLLLLKLEISPSFPAFTYILAAVEYAYLHEHALRIELREYLKRSFDVPYRLISSRSGRSIASSARTARELAQEIYGKERDLIGVTQRIAQYLKVITPETLDIEWMCPNCGSSFYSASPKRPGCCPYCLCAWEGP